MQKTPVGSFDSKTGVFTPAPSIASILAARSRSMLRFSPESFRVQSSSEPPVVPNTHPNLVPPSAPAGPSGLQHGGGTLYYGGAPARTPYKVGCKPAAGTSFRKQRRFELIARMENAALPEGQIALLLGISKDRLRSIKQHPDYLKARMAVTLGIIVDTDARLAEIREQRKDMLRQMLPPALQVIANAVNTPALSYADKKLQISVAQDILDREGTFAKISRSEIKPVEHFQWETADAEAKQVIDVLKGTMRVRQVNSFHREYIDTSEDQVFSGSAEVEKIIEISRAFSSGAGPSPEAQQEALKTLEG